MPPNRRHTLMKLEFEKLEQLRVQDGDPKHVLRFEDICQVMELAGGYQPGDLEWLCSLYTIQIELTDKGREEIVTRQAQAEHGIVTRLCACGCGQQLAGNGKQRFVSNVHRQRFYRQKLAAAHQG